MCRRTPATESGGDSSGQSMANLCEILSPFVFSEGPRHVPVWSQCDVKYSVSIYASDVVSLLKPPLKSVLSFRGRQVGRGASTSQNHQSQGQSCGCE